MSIRLKKKSQLIKKNSIGIIKSQEGIIYIPHQKQDFKSIQQCLGLAGIFALGV